MRIESNLKMMECLTSNLADLTSGNEVLSFSGCLIMITCDICKEVLPKQNTDGQNEAVDTKVIR